MKHTWTELALIPIAIILIGALLWSEFSTQRQTKITPVPDFSSIQDVKLKKKTFFEFMLPKVRAANQKIRQDRRFLVDSLVRLNTGATLNTNEEQRLLALATKYRIKANVRTDLVAQQELLQRVDTVPASLALAQAANESGWGTARFATNGNNYFGIWCWSKNCGLVPGARNKGAKHEVSKYASIQDGVDYYMLTLNSHPAYDTLRDIRGLLRKNKTAVLGYDLAAGLTRYSERGDTYVEEIRQMIVFNDLRRFARVEFDL